MAITGRKKELQITAGGENVPPVLIEAEMKQAMPALSNVMVIGDRRKYLFMLLSLKTAVDPAMGAPTSQLAADALYEGRRMSGNSKTPPAHKWCRSGPCCRETSARQRAR